MKSSKLKVILNVKFLLIIFLCAVSIKCYSQSYPTDSLITGWYFVIDSTKGYKIELDKSQIVYYLSSRPFIRAKDIEKVQVILTKDKIHAVEMKFNDKATKVWEVATARSYMEPCELAFILKGKLIFVASAKNGRISNGIAAIIRDVYSIAEVEEMKSLLEQKNE